MDINTSVGMISHLLSRVMPVVKFVFHIPEDERCFSNTSLTQQDHLKGITSSAILTCTSPGAADRHCFRFFFVFYFWNPFLFQFLQDIFVKNIFLQLASHMKCYTNVTYVETQICKQFEQGLVVVSITNTPHFDLNLMQRKKTTTMSSTKNAISKHCSISYPINVWTPSVVVNVARTHTQKKKNYLFNFGDRTDIFLVRLSVPIRPDDNIQDG